MPRTAPLAARPRESASWPLIGTAFVSVGLLLVVSAAFSGDADVWPGPTALAGGGLTLAGGILVLFGLVADLFEPKARRQTAGRGGYRPADT